MLPTDTLEPPESAHQHAAMSRKVANLLDALRTGRLRIVDRPLDTTIFCPRMEIYDDPDSLNIVATFEIPGVKVSDVSISLKPGQLEIRGQRLSRYSANPRRHPSVREHPSEVDAAPTRSNNTRFFPYRELRYGSFYRRLRLPPSIDISCITATMSDGLLTVSWPRSPSCEQIGLFSMTGAADSSEEHQTSPVPSDLHGLVEHDSR
ncbi:HSP20-like chaperone [Mycena latifolia]|nr:HSP20-like chaperone [Mycena latifolia]